MKIKLNEIEGEFFCTIYKSTVKLIIFKFKLKKKCLIKGINKTFSSLATLHENFF